MCSKTFDSIETLVSHKRLEHNELGQSKPPFFAYLKLQPEKQLKNTIKNIASNAIRILRTRSLGGMSKSEETICIDINKKPI
jgi:hypothetical protein